MTQTASLRWELCSRIYIHVVIDERTKGIWSQESLKVGGETATPPIVRRATARIHTHGLREVGLPELEARDIPAFLLPHARALIEELTSDILMARLDPEPGCVLQCHGDGDMFDVRLRRAPPLQCADVEGESRVVEVLSQVGD